MGSVDEVVSVSTICHYDINWAHNLTAQTSLPYVPPCLYLTLGTWVTCGLLWLAALGYVPYLWTLEALHSWCGTSPRNTAKMVVISLLILTSLCHLAAVPRLASHIGMSPIPFYTSDGLCLATYALAAILTRWAYRKGQNSPGILFIFWLLQLSADTMAVTSNIADSKRQGSLVDVGSSVALYIRMVLGLIQMILCWASDDSALYPTLGAHKGHTQDMKSPLLAGGEDLPEHETNDKPCPIFTASFISRVYYTWFLKKVIYAYRHTLTFNDVWDVQRDNSSVTLVPAFEKAWNGQIQDKRSKAKRKNTVQPNTYGGTTSSSSQATQRAHKSSSTKCPSLTITLAKLVGLYFTLSNTLIVGMVVCSTLIPLIVGLLIQFLETPSEGTWYGMVLTFTLSILSALNVLFFVHALFSSYVTGMRARTAAMCAIYRKSLKLSNSARKAASSGDIVNLLAVDAQRLATMFVITPIIFPAPLVIGFSMYFQLQTIGPSCLAGFFILLVVLPILSYVLGNWIKELQNSQMMMKDERMKLMSRLVNGIQVVKLNAWESYFQRTVTRIRVQELSKQKSSAVLYGVILSMWLAAPIMALVADFLTVSLVSPDNPLDAKTAFTLMTFFNVTNYITFNIPFGISIFIEGWVSLKRIEAFLNKEDYDESTVKKLSSSASAIKIENGMFAWDKESKPTLSSIHLNIPSGKLVAVVGQVGAGKSSLIHAILGEMDVLAGTVSVNGSLAYVSQQAWIQNLSLRDNIQFSRGYSADQYRRVLRACALETDIELLPAGDQTEIGERGVNLSGGQKQRVSLARGVYQDADIYLLDDPLSAVDARVGKHIFDNVIGPAGLLHRETRLLVTHGITHLSQTDLIVVMKEGRVSEVGDYKQLLLHQGAFCDFINTYLSNKMYISDEEMEVIIEFERITSESDSSMIIDADSCRKRLKKNRKNQTDLTDTQEEMQTQVLKHKDRLIVEETAMEGSISFAVWTSYIKATTLPFYILILVLFFLFILVTAFSGVWLSLWTEDAKHNATDPNVPTVAYRVTIFGVLGLLQVILGIALCSAYALGAIKASSTLHDALLDNILRSPMSFFDTNPVGRILNRFSKDFNFIDTMIPQLFVYLITLLGALFADLVVIMYTIPMMILPVILMVAVFIALQRAYMSTLRQLQRLDSIRTSPVFAFFTEMLQGSSTIRAYNKQSEFIHKADRLVDDSSRTYYEVFVCSRWSNIVSEVLSDAIVLLVTLTVVGEREVLPTSLVSMAISLVLRVNTNMSTFVRCLADCESYMVSVERVKEYSDLVLEPPWRLPASPPPSDWPREGAIEFRDYCVRYREGLDLVLKDTTCRIPARAKVGVVGRTGAGKSSLTLALFRILEAASGKILIDDVNIADIGLHDLREKLTIIPQVPELFSGSLRFNLDPADQHTDTEVWTALQQAHLRTYVEGLPRGLMYECGEGGDNFSVGQRQLICLARALLRKTKILILDEATAAVDMETDDLIQSTIRSEFSDCTLITIAHRLNTVLDYDYIIVMVKGRIAEMEPPKVLLDNKQSVFHSIAKDAGIVNSRPSSGW